ncbi:MAG: RCC1 domain-containing protein [Eubacteriaceae bacterium]
MIKQTKIKKYLKKSIKFFLMFTILTFFSAIKIQSMPMAAPQDAPNYGQLSAVKFVEVGNAYLGGIALDASGKIWSWGWNQHGQLGIAKKYYINSANPGYQGYAGGMVRIPYFVDNNINVVSISGGYHHFLALDDQGVVYSWGNNLDQQVGVIGYDAESGTGKNSPQIVQGLPKITKIIANNGYLNDGFSLGLDENGNPWVWGDNGYGQHGQGNITGTSAYQVVPHQIDFASKGVSILDISAGWGHIIASDNHGDVWTWGWGYHGALGDGTTLGNVTTPKKMTKPNGMGNVVEVDASYHYSMARTDDGEVWQWGQIFGRTDDSNYAGFSKDFSTPVPLEIKASEIDALGYTPTAVSIAAGESVSYFIDQHGRSWSWGDGRYFGFGREGGYENSNDQREYQAVQYPKVIGDGDTQIYDTDLKTPSDGRAPIMPQGVYSFNTLHPTVYDVKYQNSTRNETWKELALKEVPYISSIYGSRSGYAILDNDGNLYRWSNDGSGAIAWGWDYDSRYDLTGNSKDGLYDKYAYEVIFMRGAPTIPPIDVQFSTGKTKIYKNLENSQSNQIGVAVTIPQGSSSDQMNITVNAELNQIKAIVMPFNQEDPYFSRESLSKSEFMELYESGSYTRYDLLEEGTVVGNTEAPKVIEKSLEIKDNGKIFVMVDGISYTKAEERVIAYTADNFYTPIEIKHQGVSLENEQMVVYAPTGDNVTKETIDEVTTEQYGYPLDAQGNIIRMTETYAPTFGYDQVRISRYETLPDPLENYWVWSENGPTSTQEESVIWTLDDQPENNHFAPKNSHNFYYKKNANGWINVTYEGLFKETGQPVEGFGMGEIQNPESVEMNKALTRMAPIIGEYVPIGYKIDGGEIKSLEGDKSFIFTPTKDTVVSIIYGQKTLHVRQVVLNKNLQISKPAQGTMVLKNQEAGTGRILDNRNMITTSGNDGSQVGYQDYIISPQGGNTEYSLALIIPQYYQYVGFVKTETKDTHHPDDRLTEENILLDYSQRGTATEEYWVTVYIKPTTTTPGFFNWDIIMNAFGQIKL